MISIRGKTVGLIVGLVILLCVTTIAQGQKKIQLSVWGMPWEDQIYTKYALPQFETKYPDIKVEFIRLENYWELLLTRHAAGEAPDVQRNLDMFYGRMRIRGALVPLTKYIKGPDGISLDDFYETGIEAVTREGEIWALPQDLCLRQGLYYNMRMFDEAGISYPTDEWTMDDVVNAARKLTKGKRPRVEQYGFVGLSQDLPFWFIYNYGGTLWSEDGKRCTVNSEAAIKGIKRLQDLIYEEKVVPTTAEYTVAAVEDLFKAEKVAMFLGGMWFVPSITRDVPDLEFGIARTPIGPLGKRICTAHQCIWEMSSQTEYPDASWKLIKHLSSPPVLKEYWQRTWVAAPARRSMLTDPTIFENIIGIPGHVPGIEDPDEFERKVGWLRDTILNKEFITIQNDFFLEFYNEIFFDELANLFGIRKGNAEEILNRVAEKQNKLMREFYSQ